MGRLRTAMKFFVYGLAIGLLFAGNNTEAFANPIGQVLNFLGATMVGN